MRAHHATWNEDGTIAFNGKTYKQLPESDTFSPLNSDFDTIYVTEVDVPVLLSSMIGKAFDLSKDGNFIRLYSDIYCVMDIYDEVAQKIEAGDPMLHYCLEYQFYDDDVNYYVNSRILLSNEVVTGCKQALTKEPIDLPPGTKLDYNKRIFIYRCSEDMTFLSNTSVFQIWYIRSPEVYYLVVENIEEQTTDYYTIDEQYLASLKDLFSKTNK